MSDLQAYQKQQALIYQDPKFQKIVEKLQSISEIDLNREEHCQAAVYCFQKKVKLEQDAEFIKKILQSLKIFKDKKHLLDIDRNLYIGELTVQYYHNNHTLFKKGDDGETYYYVLKGQCYLTFPQNNNEDEENNKQQNQPSTRREHKEHEKKHKNQQFIVMNKHLKNMDTKQFITEYLPQDQLIHIFNPGDSFGEIALVTQVSQRTGSVICSGDTILMELTKQGFENILGEYQRKLTSQNMQFFKNFSFLDQVSQNYLMSLTHEVNTMYCVKSKVIYNEGDSTRYIYLIKEGEIKFSKLVDLNDKDVNQQNKNKRNNIKGHNLNFVTQNQQKKKFQKRVDISILGQNQYFGEYEIIKKIPKRVIKAEVCSRTAILYKIQKKRFLYILSLFHSIPAFLRQAKTKNAWSDYREEDLVSISKMSQEPVRSIHGENVFVMPTTQSVGSNNNNSLLSQNNTIGSIQMPAKDSPLNNIFKGKNQSDKIALQEQHLQYLQNQQKQNNLNSTFQSSTFIKRSNSNNNQDIMSQSNIQPQNSQMMNSYNSTKLLFSPKIGNTNINNINRKFQEQIQHKTSIIIKQDYLPGIQSQKSSMSNLFDNTNIQLNQRNSQSKPSLILQQQQNYRDQKYRASQFSNKQLNNNNEIQNNNNNEKSNNQNNNISKINIEDSVQNSSVDISQKNLDKNINNKLFQKNQNLQQNSQNQISNQSLTTNKQSNNEKKGSQKSINLDVQAAYNFVNPNQAKFQKYSEQSINYGQSKNLLNKSEVIVRKNNNSKEKNEIKKEQKIILKNDIQKNFLERKQNGTSLGNIYSSSLSNNKETQIYNNNNKSTMIDKNNNILEENQNNENHTVIAKNVNINNQFNENSNKHNNNKIHVRNINSCRQFSGKKLLSPQNGISQINEVVKQNSINNKQKIFQDDNEDKQEQLKKINVQAKKNTLTYKNRLEAIFNNQNETLKQIQNDKNYNLTKSHNQSLIHYNYGDNNNINSKFHQTAELNDQNSNKSKQQQSQGNQIKSFYINSPQKKSNDMLQNQQFLRNSNGKKQIMNPTLQSIQFVQTLDTEENLSEQQQQQFNQMNQTNIQQFQKNQEMTEKQKYIEYQIKTEKMKISNNLQNKKIAENQSKRQQYLEQYKLQQNNDFQHLPIHSTIQKQVEQVTNQHNAYLQKEKYTVGNQLPPIDHQQNFDLDNINTNSSRAQIRAFIRMKKNNPQILKTEQSQL